MRLKILSFSKNKLHTLPNYICQMDELKILRIDRNPLVDLPQELYGLEDDGYADKEGWLEKLKAHLRQNMERQYAPNETEDSNSRQAPLAQSNPYLFNHAHDCVTAMGRMIQIIPISESSQFRIII